MPELTPVTLITGTRKGLGRHLAEHYVNCGHTVVGCSRQEIDWELDGYTFEVDDALSGLERERISRRSTALYLRESRIEGSLYEDEIGGDLLSKQFAACVKHIGKVYCEGEELTEAVRADVLDSISIVARDVLSNEVSGANALGLKNASG